MLDSAKSNRWTFNRQGGPSPNFVQHRFTLMSKLRNFTIYKDFEFEGKKVFSGMGGDNKEITFMKKKFFQSCLNHII